MRNRKIEPSTWLPDDTQVVSLVNCQTGKEEGGHAFVLVLDRKNNAECIFKDDLGEYRVAFYPDLGWAWG